MVGHGVTLWTSMPQFALDELASTVSQAAVLELRCVVLVLAGHSAGRLPWAAWNRRRITRLCRAAPQLGCWLGGSRCQMLRPVVCNSACRGQLPGLVLDFLQDGDAAAFDKLFESVLAEAFWCCFTWGEHDEEYRQLQYAAPPPYAVDGAWLPCCVHVV